MSIKLPSEYNFSWRVSRWRKLNREGEPYSTQSSLKKLAKNAKNIIALEHMDREHVMFEICSLFTHLGSLHGELV